MNQPLVSIDVVPFRYNRAADALEVILGRRQFEPSIGSLALPGVLLLAQERLGEAVGRALNTKAGLAPRDIATAGEVGVFDTPGRDPRGPTLSITRFAIIDTDTVGATAEAVPIAEVSGLPFDHDVIIAMAARRVYEKLFTDREVAEALLGPEFDTVHAFTAQQQLAAAAEPVGEPLSLANLARTLTNLGWVEATGELGASRGGRRPKVWRFTPSA
ncbi:hypothetical protein ACFVAJ_18530 [Agromyces sp. NPDC057679]|uniref:hypothetical protein n=1 Tax=Agromyces sp. NPDC057679 TaxID=3346207 RepID=UPI00366ECE05